MPAGPETNKSCTMSHLSQTSTALQRPVRGNQMIPQSKNTYLEDWEEKNQHRLDCYLNKSEYLSAVREIRQKLETFCMEMMQRNLLPQGLTTGTPCFQAAQKNLLSLSS